MKNFVLFRVSPLLLLLLLGAQDPLTNEDVVMRVASGMSVRDLVAEIERSPVDFDLSEDMQNEMRIAGVPEEVLQAMRARQAELAPPPPEEPVAPGGTITVLLEAGHDTDPPIVIFPAPLGPAAAAELQLEESREPREVESLAVFLACLTPRHVPHQWRAASPLGQDFVSMPRHEMLAFHRGSDRIKVSELPAKVRLALPGKDFDEVLRLALPEGLAAAVDPAEPHDLMLGVAIQVEGRFLRIVSRERKGVPLIDGKAGLRARITFEKKEDGTFTMQVDFLDGDPAS